ncbi:PAS domain S-box protein [Heliorestis convoluta]|uniref:histidine kinase n=1 Tax=Heliorestis convoluta TaxID=356322 RepID=A0A5Q2N6N3_9FIRM|nr:PAS domain S-box protein [Heliorestis convoluta]QGG48215.1 PAS domain S-box protein [Heliorestis convoluta]
MREKIKGILRKIYPLPLTKRVYFSILFLVLLYTIGMTGIVHLGFIKKERYERNFTLHEITYAMAERIAHIYQELAQKEEKVAETNYESQLNESMQFFLAELARKYPGVNMAFYYNETGQLINYEEDKKINIQVIDRIFPVDNFRFKVSETNKEIITILEKELQKGLSPTEQSIKYFSWTDDPSIYVIRPVYADDKLIGYCWGSINKNKFHGIVNLRTAEVAFIQMFIAALCILLAWHIFRRLKIEMESFGVAATQTDEALLLQTSFPELRPLLEKMSTHSHEIEIANNQLAKETIERIRAQQELIRFFALSLDFLCIIDFQGQIKRWNLAFEKTIAQDIKELHDRPLHLFIHPEDRQSFEEAIELTKKGVAEANREVRFYCRSGEYKWINWNAVPVVEEGLIYIAGRDVTEQKEMMRKLHLSEELFSKVFHANPNPMTINELETCKFVEVNASFLEVTGFTREEIVGKIPEERNLWTMDPSLFDSSHKQQGTCIMRNEEKEVSVSKGETRNWLISTEVVELNNHLCYITAANDITERKKFEKEIAALDRLNLVAQMAAGIGHEIRNPMTTVRGYLQIISNKDIYKADKKNFDLMIDELDRANMIITEFLSLAKNKAENRKKTNLNNILQYLYPLIEANAILAEKKIILEQQDIPDLLLDEKEIRQLILNITRNGLEAMEPGGTLRIQTYLDEEKVVMAVQDEGKGIEKAVVDKIGTPFFTTKENGTGLGLAVCQSIVKRHNATLTFDTSREGTTFITAFQQEESNGSSSVDKKSLPKNG